ncbi:MAG: PilZ domain-containing protein [Pontixanthobacter sp.]
MTVPDASLDQTRTIRRKCSRLSTELPLHLRTLSGYQPCVLRDLSLTGMRIRFSRDCHFARDLRFGSGAQLTWDRFDEYGEFMWISRLPNVFSAGIRFYDPIDPQVIFATRDLHDDFWAKNVRKSPESEVTRNWVASMCA